MKKELENVPFLGPACKAMGHIFIDRSDTEKAVESINAARKKIVNGTSVLFFSGGVPQQRRNYRPIQERGF
jgi:1-acyl-sn-glycerol-3-phosphate acyltransferase